MPFRIFHLKNLCILGWSLVAILAFPLLRRVHAKFDTTNPQTIRKNWSRILESKTTSIRNTTWNDTRPLYLFAGDSHIEMADWYQLLDGRIAIRNCGLSQAKINDVSTLIKLTPDRNIHRIVIMCGINDITSGNNAGQSLRSYRELLQTCASRVQPQSIIVLSVMPLQTKSFDSKNVAANRDVARFNQMLSQLCAEMNVRYTNVTDCIATKEGALVDAYTTDGLHLNKNGYMALAECIANRAIDD